MGLSHMMQKFNIKEGLVQVIEVLNESAVLLDNQLSFSKQQAPIKGAPMSCAVQHLFWRISCVKPIDLKE